MAIRGGFPGDSSGRRAAARGGLALVVALAACAACAQPARAPDRGEAGAGEGGAADRGTGGATTGSGTGGTTAPGTGGAPAPGIGGGAGAGTGGARTTGAGGGAGGNTGAGGTGLGGRGAGGAGTDGGSSALLVPAQGALLGAFVGTGTIPQLETTLGRKLAISHNFFGWTDDYSVWARTALGGGYIPLITWETWVNGVGVPLDEILAGTHDAMIRARAASLRALGQPLFLRWGHEMNGNWYPWDGSHNGASAAATAKYVAAYRHIHDLFAAAAASNVLWVFSPNVDSVPGDAWNQWQAYYPGDSYVDWMAFDGYNWGTVQTGSSWRPFAALVSTIYPTLAAKGKPIMIAETASAELGGDKAAWIAAILPGLRASYPAIKALVWFHMNKETDWRVDSSVAARDAFVALARDPFFNP